MSIPRGTFEEMSRRYERAKNGMKEARILEETNHCNGYFEWALS